ncbi:hypothetical protein TNCV_2710291 [Trichonephila clavipes]|nr:hypothetical protein TNCV_2710291 [Trichonephila clavipes]
MFGSGKWLRIDFSDVVGESVTHLIIEGSSRVFVFLEHPNPPRREDYLFRDLLLPTTKNYHFAPTKVAADTPVRTIYFSEAYYTPPLKVRQLFVLSPVMSPTHLHSQYRPT